MKGKTSCAFLMRIFEKHMDLYLHEKLSTTQLRFVVLFACYLRRCIVMDVLNLLATAWRLDSHWPEDASV